MKSVVTLLAAISLSLGTVSAHAEPIQYPRTDLPDRGGRLGITVDTKYYTFKGINVIKVVEVGQNSPLYGSVYPGDFIYAMNGFYLRDDNDILAVVSSGPAGASIILDFLSARQNYQAMHVTVRSISYAAAEQGSTQQSASSSSGSKTFCEEYSLLCGLGAITAIGIGAAMLSGAGSSSSGGSSSTCHTVYPTMRDSQTGQPIPGGAPYQECD